MNKIAIKKLKEDLLIPEGKLFEVIKGLKVDWNKIESEDPLSYVIETYKDNIPEPVISGVVVKNKEKGLKLKTKGNELYKEGNLLEAREVYTEAMRFCPLNEKNPMENKDFAIIVANRSAASEGLGIYQGVIQDVDLALKYGYPREMHYKVLNRKAQAFKKTRQFFSSKETYKKCLDMIGKSDMPTKIREQWRNKTNKQINLFAIKKDAQPAKESLHPFDNLTDGASEEIPEMSSKLSVKEDKINVIKEVNTEDRLLLESPIATILSDPKSYGKLCPYTLKKMSAPVVCNFGSSELFYDEESRAKAIALFHKYEWSIIKDLKENLAPIGRLALRLILKNNPKIIQNQIEKISKEEAFFGGLVGVYLHKALIKAKFPESLSMGEVAKFVIFSLKTQIPIFMLLKEEDRSKLIEGNDKVHPRRNYAIGIYPQFSFLISKSKPSHSNDVFTHFIGQKLLVISNRRIRKDDVISFKSMANMGSAMNDVVLYKCEGSPKCQLSFPLKEKTNEQVIICPLPQCGVDTNIWRHLKRLHELKKDIYIAKERFIGAKTPDSIREALSKYQDVIDEFETFIERPYKGITEMEKEVKLYIEVDMLGKEEIWNNRSDTEFKNDLFA
uniref:SET and MYND domaincontaining protein 4like [Bombus terrestris] n=2 Tax=Lepeophtheirus salmonis TaxID=72036 RepID=A0A0K2TBM5_LEPSM